MLRTLHSYIWRDLLRVGALALVAFTLVIAIFVIIDKAREHSLSASETAFVFGLTLPVMLTLTMPVASLFATTIVYGRFGQDNELMACRASGICTLTLLKPALILGAVVTVVCLLLNSFVAPKLTAAGERAVKASAREIAYHAIRTEGYRKWKNYIVYADRVEPDRDRLGGVVVIDRSEPSDIRVLVASQAKVDLTTSGEKTYAQVNLEAPAVFTVGSKQVVWEASQQTPPLELPSEFKYKPAFFDWKQLLAIQRDPANHPAVRDGLIGLRRKLCKILLAEDVAAGVRDGNTYDRLREGADVYRIRAGTAAVDGKGKAVLGTRVGPDGKREEVEVVVVRNGEVRRVAASGKVEAIWMGDLPTGEQSWLVQVELGKTVWVYDTRFGPEPRRRKGWKRGRLLLPSDIQRRSEAIGLQDIFHRPDRLTQSEAILKQMDHWKNTVVSRLLGKVTAEIHGRLAYGLSCFLLVALGAALGLIFRDGQTISAFALSIAPASAMILLIYMGKKVIENPGSPQQLGMAAIWGGVLALLAIDLLIYVRLGRR